MLDDDVIDFTPELRAQALEVLKQYDRGPLFTPPSERGTVQMPGQRRRRELGRRGRRSGDRDALRAVAHQPDHRAARRKAIRRGATFSIDAATQQLPTLDGLPLYKPPYSRVTAYDLNTGTIAWQVPIGDGPRNHPLLKHLNLGPLGSGAAGGAAGHVDAAVHRAVVGRIGPRAGLEGWRS